MTRRLNADAATTFLARLDEPAAGTAIDLGPTGINGTAVGTAAVPVTDEPFTYVRGFTRASEEDIEFADNAAFKPASAITVEAVVNAVNVGGGANQVIATRYSASTFDGWLFGIYSTDISFAVKAGASYRSTTVSYFPYFGARHRVAGAYDGRRTYLYIDGVLVGSTDHGSTANISYASAVNMYVGSWRPYNPTQKRYFQGTIAEVRISNVARKPWEIFNTVKAVTDPQIGFAVEPGSVAVYNFNNPLEGATVYDDTGNHNGSVSGNANVVNSPVSSKGRDFIGNGRILVPHHTDFSILNDFTIEVWFRPSLISSLKWIVTKTRTNEGGYGISADYYDGSMLEFAAYDGSTSVNPQSPTGYLVAGRLYYAVTTWEAAAKKAMLYGNGVILASHANMSLNLASVDNTRQFAIGGPEVIDGYNSDFRGLVAAVRFSNYIKAPKEIYDYYNGSVVKEIG
jgi:hypothetical protein